MILLFKSFSCVFLCNQLGSRLQNLDVHSSAREFFLSTKSETNIALCFHSFLKFLNFTIIKVKKKSVPILREPVLRIRNDLFLIRMSSGSGSNPYYSNIIGNKKGLKFNKNGESTSYLTFYFSWSRPTVHTVQNSQA